jgi:hypothetical protein
LEKKYRRSPSASEERGSGRSGGGETEVDDTEVDETEVDDTEVDETEDDETEEAAMAGMLSARYDIFRRPDVRGPG